VLHISATVGLRWMHLAFTVLSVRRLYADQPGVTGVCPSLPDSYAAAASRSRLSGRAGSCSEVRQVQYTNLEPVAMEINDTINDSVRAWVARFVFSQAMIERLDFCFRASSGSVQFYYMTALSRRTTDGRSSFFALRSVMFSKSLWIIDTECKNNICISTIFSRSSIF